MDRPLTLRALSLCSALGCSALIACSEPESAPPKPVAAPAPTPSPTRQPASPQSGSPGTLSAVQHPAQPEIIRPTPTAEPSRPSPAEKRPTAEDFRGDLCAFAHFVLTSPELPPREKSPDPPCFSDTNPHEVVQPFGVSYAALTAMCSNPAGRLLDVGLAPGALVPNCGKLKRICSETGTRAGYTSTYYQFSDGPLKGVVLNISEWKRVSARLPPPASGMMFYTLPYALAEDQWGGECLEKNRRKLR